MGKTLELIGKRFGSLLVISRAGSSPHKKSTWLCRCDCGVEKVMVGSSLVCGLVVSCGCNKNRKVKERSITHGMSKHKLYHIYNSMISRCYNPNNKDYKYYGERGITICSEWLENFIEFKDWAITNAWVEGLSIERKDFNENYCPENCCWIPMSEQHINRRKRAKNPKKK